MYRYVYNAVSAPEGGFVVGLPSFPEIVTQGEDMADARANAQDALDEALANRIVSGLPVPKPDARVTSRHVVEASPYIALKTALYDAMRRAHISRTKLAGMLDVGETEVRRMLDPRHSTRFERLVSALRLLGTDVRVELKKIA